MDPKQKEHQQAFQLYFQSDMSQEQIAALLNVNRKTLYTWIKEGEWKRARYAARHTPCLLVEQYYEQLAKINRAIAARTESPYPTREEADVIRKISMTVKQMRTTQTISESIAAFTEFTLDLTNNGKAKEARDIMPYFKKYISKKVEKGSNLDYMNEYYEDLKVDKEYEQWLAENEPKTEPAAEKETIIIPLTPSPRNGVTPAPQSKAEDQPESATSNNITETNNQSEPTENMKNGVTNNPTPNPPK